MLHDDKSRTAPFNVIRIFIVIFPVSLREREEGVGEREGEGERQTDIKRQTERDGGRERQTDRARDSNRDRETATETTTDRQRERVGGGAWRKRQRLK